jgi:hypothetical protein
MCEYAGRTGSELSVHDQTWQHVLVHPQADAVVRDCTRQSQVLFVHATKHLVANGVDANADAMIDFMHAKSMIGSMPATAIMRVRNRRNEGASLVLILM